MSMPVIFASFGKRTCAAEPHPASSTRAPFLSNNASSIVPCNWSIAAIHDACCGRAVLLTVTCSPGDFPFASVVPAGYLAGVGGGLGRSAEGHERALGDQLLTLRFPDHAS